MVIQITGATHTGKTRLSQHLLETYHYPYVSLDHIKMGLIRSHNTGLTPEDDSKLTEYLWPITREIIKTVIENGQNLIIEGCYMPFNWKSDFEDAYLQKIRYLCICFSERYIEQHYKEIRQYANCIEQRTEDGYCSVSLLKRDNLAFLHGCRSYGLPYVCIENDYESELRKSIQI